MPRRKFIKPDHKAVYAKRMNTGIEGVSAKKVVEKFGKEDLRKMLLKTMGNRKQCADNFKCHVSTISYAMARWPELLEVEREARAEMWDIAVGKLKQALDAGEPWAIRETLRRFGKDRGIEPQRVEITGSNGSPINVLQVNVTPEQIKHMSDELILRVLDGDSRALTEASAIVATTRH